MTTDPKPWGNDVAGKCPACGRSSLFVAFNGHVTCRIDKCPDPCAADDVLHGSATEVATLRAAITEALIELDEAHQPMWASESAKAAGKEPWVCQTCGTSDGAWPCVSRMVADDLRASVSSEGSG